MGAPNNRTLKLGELEQAALASRLIRPGPLPGVEGLSDQLLCGDAIKLIPQLPAGIADLIIVDPPYNLSRTFGATEFRESSTDVYAVWIRTWLPGLRRLLKDDGSLYVCADWRCSGVIQRELESTFHIQNRITWEREKGRGAKANWKNASEDIWFCTADPDRYYFDLESVKLRRKVIAPYRKGGQPKDWEQTERGNFRRTHPSNLWTDLTVPFWSMAENTEHPTQKPEKLIAKLILASSAPGALVFDPFLGSGTTAVVAGKLGRKFLGIDREESYLCLAAKRLAQASVSPEIQGYSDGVFWERNSTPPAGRRDAEG